MLDVNIHIIVNMIKLLLFKDVIIDSEINRLECMCFMNDIYFILFYVFILYMGFLLRNMNYFYKIIVLKRINMNKNKRDTYKLFLVIFIKIKENKSIQNTYFYIFKKLIK